MESNLPSNKTCFPSDGRNYSLLKQLLVWYAADDEMWKMLEYSMDMKDKNDK